MTVSDSAAVVSAIGTLMAGVAAAAAVLLAALKGPGELEKWRVERREVMQAEAAGEALVALAGLVSAMRRVSTPSTRALGATGRDMLLGEVRDLWRVIEPDLRAFERAEAKAVAYLPTGAAALMSEVWQARGDVLAQQEQFFSQRRSEFGPSGDGFGPEVSARFEEFHRRGVSLLRPIAQLAARRE